MKVKRQRRWACVLFWKRPRGGEPRAEHVQPLSRSGQLQDLNVAPAQAASRPAGRRRGTVHHQLSAEAASCEDTSNDDDEEVFKSALYALEICQERDDMTTVGSESSEERDIFSPRSPDDTSMLSQPQLTDLLFRLRMRELPDAGTALQLIKQVSDHFREHGATLVRLPAPTERMIVVGDLHGHLNDLLYILDEYGEPGELNQYLFNGDFVDRGIWGPEVLFTLFCLLLLHPKRVHFNRGNHESSICNDRYGFRDQMLHAYPEDHMDMYTRVNEVFRQLPLCHTIGQFAAAAPKPIFVVHGGIPLQPVSLEEIAEVPRGAFPRECESKHDLIFRALLWSDPAAAPGPGIRGAGCQFSEFETRRFLRDNGLGCILRSHECTDAGFCESHSGLVKTVFSASNYKCEASNRGCIAVINKNLKIMRGVSWQQPLVGGSWALEMPPSTTPTPSAGGSFPAAGEEPLSAKWVRRTEWDHDDAEQTACSRLRARVAALCERDVPPRERVLRELHRMIFLARPQLLEMFEAADETSHGSVTPQCWADIMVRCLRTPPDFPWAPLGRHLYRLESDGRIPYVPFLLRYDNPFSRWLADRWCTTLLKRLALRLGASAAAEFDRLDTSRDGLLSYTELRPLVRRTQGQQLPVTRHEAYIQDLRVFAMFRNMDVQQDGFVRRQEFLAALERAGGRLLRCPNGNYLEEVQVPGCCCCRPDEMRVCNECQEEIQPGTTIRTCSTSDYDLCSTCVARFVGPDADELERSWTRAETAIRMLCRSRCDLRAVFALADSNQDGFVDRDEFGILIGELLPVAAPPNAAADLWQLLGEHCGGEGGWDGRLWLGDFRKFLEVEDAEAGDGKLLSALISPPQRSLPLFRRRASK
eukprot:TRINITY_DN51074_c0_g1_i1.p1 TRINITY_DN51074_c0_g1~~TRINITY_DN51074_c0_g1_i1.p1  ORF type:complete len:871 (+),score=188.30 TRINITY_DN51074_c0_g1_i1:82-2694(+)